MEPEPPSPLFLAWSRSWPILVGAGARVGSGTSDFRSRQKKWRLGNTGCNSLKYSLIQFFVHPPNSRSKIPVYREFDLNLCRCYKQMIYFNFEVPVFKFTEDPSLFFLYHKHAWFRTSRFYNTKNLITETLRNVVLSFSPTINFFLTLWNYFNTEAKCLFSCPRTRCTNWKHSFQSPFIFYTYHIASLDCHTGHCHSQAAVQ